jgi:hypothetical protein
MQAVVRRRAAVLALQRSQAAASQIAAAGRRRAAQKEWAAQRVGALAVATAARGLLARRLRRRMGKDYQASLRLQKHVRARARRQAYSVERAAAMVLHTQARAKLARRAAEARQRAVARVQRQARGHVARVALVRRYTCWGYRARDHGASTAELAVLTHAVLDSDHKSKGGKKERTASGGEEAVQAAEPQVRTD